MTDSGAMASVDRPAYMRSRRRCSHRLLSAVQALLFAAGLQRARCNAEAVVVQVADADSLQAAISSGVPHIEVVEHLDLEGLPAANATDATSATLQPATGLQSITVRRWPCDRLPACCGLDLKQR